MRQDAKRAFYPATHRMLRMASPRDLAKASIASTMAMKPTSESSRPCSVHTGRPDTQLWMTKHENEGCWAMQLASTVCDTGI